MGLTNLRIRLVLKIVIFFASMIYFVIFSFPYFTKTTHPMVVLGTPTLSEKELFDHWKNKTFPNFNVDKYIGYSVTHLKLNPLPDQSRALRSDFGPIVNDVFFRYSISIAACKAEYRIFFAVISAPDNFEKRQSIRQTWFRYLNFPAGFAFIIGMVDDVTLQQEIEAESSQYGDIIQVHMVDQYRNLTLKVVALFNWMNENCSHARYLLKCDDDVYVNVNTLVNLIRSLPGDEIAIYGAQFTDGIVVRDAQSKWGVSHERWPWTTYPGYLSGGCILISGRAVGLLLAAAQVTPYFDIDDVYTSGIIASKAGITIWKNWWMFVWPDNYDNFNVCSMQRSISWLTTTVSQKEEAYQLLDDLYHNRTRCLITWKDATGRNVTRQADPMIFDFKLASATHMIVGPLDEGN